MNANDGGARFEQILGEKLIRFKDAVSYLPGGLQVHYSTLHRWRIRGCRGVKLETILIGGHRYTSSEAIRRFLRATAKRGGAERN